MCCCCSPYCFLVQSWGDWRAESPPVRAVKFFDDFASEVGFFTGKRPECHLFVLLKEDVISTERPVKDKVDITVHLELGEVFRKRKQLKLYVKYIWKISQFFLNQYMSHTSPCVPDVWDGFGAHAAYIWAWIRSQWRIWETPFSRTECLCQTGQTTWSPCTSGTLLLYWYEKDKNTH